MLKLIIAQQQELIRVGLIHCFSENGYDINFELSDFSSLTGYLFNNQADILLLDGALLKDDIKHSIRIINDLAPKIKIIITTDEETYYNYYKFLNVGLISAICLKTDPCKDYTVAINSILDKGSYISTSLHKKISEHNSKLTPKELQVIELLVLGLSNKEVATSLNNSERTINVHRSNIMQKLNLTNVVELINFTYKYGMSRLNLYSN